MKANDIVGYFTTNPIFGKILVLKLWAKMLKDNLQKSMEDEVDFLPADKRQMFSQIDIIILGMCRKACPNYPK